MALIGKFDTHFDIRDSPLSICSVHTFVYGFLFLKLFLKLYNHFVNVGRVVSSNYNGRDNSGTK